MASSLKITRLFQLKKCTSGEKFKKLNVNLENFFRDGRGFQACYEPIAVIEYQGIVNSDGFSQGHYICDVKVDKTWFRTNDDSNPVEISVKNVSKQGYAFLFKQTFEL